MHGHGGPLLWLTGTLERYCGGETNAKLLSTQTMHCAWPDRALYRLGDLNDLIHLNCVEKGM